MTDENLNKEDDLAKVTASHFLEELYGDPLRTETIRTGRYLVVASTICISVVVLKVRLQSTNLIPLDFGNRADALPMLLAIGVLLLFISFLLRAVTDLLRDRETALLVTRYIERERTAAALEEAREVDREIAAGQDEEYNQEPDPWWAGYSKIREAADGAVKCEGVRGDR